MEKLIEALEEKVTFKSKEALLESLRKIVLSSYDKGFSLFSKTDSTRTIAAACDYFMKNYDSFTQADKEKIKDHIILADLYVSNQNTYISMVNWMKKMAEEEK